MTQNATTQLSDAQAAKVRALVQAAATRVRDTVVTVDTKVLSVDPWMGEHERVIHHWTITTNTGFRFEASECPCGLRKQTGLKYATVPMDAPDWATRPREIVAVYSVPMVECLCAYESGRCTRATARDRDRRCHGWHQARIDRLVAHLEGRVKPYEPTQPKRQDYSGRELVELPGVNWPERRDPVRAVEHAFCDCGSCRETVDRFSK